MNLNGRRVEVTSAVLMVYTGYTRELCGNARGNWSSYSIIAICAIVTDTFG